MADCVLLFSLGFYDAFPADVWIKRVMREHYGFVGSDKAIYEFARDKFGEYAGSRSNTCFSGKGKTVENRKQTATRYDKI